MSSRFNFIFSLILLTLCDQIICELQLPEGVAAQNIEIALDHFNLAIHETWNMTYLENKKHCAADGPIFVLVELANRYLVSGQLYDLAAKSHGCLFSIPIRFYTHNFPSDYLGRLEYLNVEQILEDMTYFVDEIKLRNAELKNSKVIFSGHGLFGAFVVWFKRMYSDKIDAGWVSNAPIEAKMDVPDLNNVVGDLIRDVGGYRCYKEVRKGINHLSKLFETGNGEEVRKALHICPKFDEKSSNDVSTLFEIIAFGWSIKSFFRESITHACSQILNGSRKYEGFTNELLNFSHQDPCWKITFEAFVSERSVPETSVRIHQFYHQACNEFGWWPTSTSRYQLLGSNIPLAFHVNTCAKLFGEKYTLDHMQGKIDEFNKNYGGRDPNVENIFFMQSNFGSSRSLTHKEAILFPDPMFGNDFDRSTANDSPALKVARELISDSITKIINGKM